MLSIDFSFFSSTSDYLQQPFGSSRSRCFPAGVVLKRVARAADPLFPHPCVTHSSHQKVWNISRFVFLPLTTALLRRMSAERRREAGKACRAGHPQRESGEELIAPAESSAALAALPWASGAPGAAASVLPCLGKRLCRITRASTSAAGEEKCHPDGGVPARLSWEQPAAGKRRLEKRSSRHFE